MDNPLRLARVHIAVCDELGVMVRVEVRSPDQRVPRALVHRGVDDDRISPTCARVHVELSAQDIRVQRQSRQTGGCVEAAQTLEAFLGALFY